MSGTFIKSLVLFNLDDIVASNIKKLLDYIFHYNITNKQDIYSLFTYFNLSDIIDIYKNNNGMIVFYLSVKAHNQICEDDGIVRDMNFAKFSKLLTKRIRFPIIISNLSFNGLKHVLEDDSPEYDELVGDYQFISSIYDDIVSVIKKLKFYSLEDNLVNSVKDRIKLLTVFKN